MFQTIEFEGKLAVALGFVQDWDEPKEVRQVWVSPIDVEEARHLVGLCNGKLRDGGVWFWRPDAVPVRFEMDQWRKVTDTRPVPKPRKRGAWGWWGGWYRL